MIKRIRALLKNESFMRYFKNSSWMFAEYMLRIISAIFVIIYVARYLGPEQFGILSYALAVVAIFMAISRLGMESILVRDLSKYPERAKAFMGTAFGLMMMAAFVSLVVLSALIYLFESNYQIKIYIWIIATSLFFQTCLVVDFFFQAQVRAKYSSIAKSIALAISSAIKIYLVWIEADLIAFAIAHALDHLIIALMLLSMYFAKKQTYFISAFERSLVKPLLSSAWPMVSSAVAGMLYMRVDQIMIKNMLDAHQLGLYTAATKIYEGWIIVPFVISISMLPAIVKLKLKTPESYEANLTKLFALVFWPGVLVAIIATFASELIIRVSFGEAFTESATVLAIVMWSAAFTAIGSITARYLTVEGMEKKIALRTFIALIINVFLNMILIPIYGIEGAALATLATILCANYLINYTDSDLKQLLRVCNNAILFKKYHTVT